MDSKIIKAHKFEKAKNKIQVFSKQLPSNCTLKSVAEDGFIFEHKVTGREMNNVISSLQKTFIEHKTVLSKIIGEFQTVYETFDYLDKDYIQSILVAIKSAEEASNQANVVSKQALRNGEDIRKVVETIDALVKKLQVKFEKLELQYNRVENNIEGIEYISQKLKSIKYFEEIDTTRERAIDNDIKIKELNEKLLNLSDEFKDHIDKVQQIQKIETDKIFQNLKKQYSNKLMVAYVIAIISLIISSAHIAINLLN